MAQRQPKEMTGRKVLIITVSAFGVIVTVNLIMAWVAVGTFPGLQVQNSYVASQGFNQRLAEQRALGWDTEVDLTGNRLTLRIDDENGAPVVVPDLTVTLGRPASDSTDFQPVLRRENGAYVADVDVDCGNWMVIVDATAADGTPFSQRIGLIHRR